MPTYKYLDPEQTLVAVFDDDGLSRKSGSASIVPEGEYIDPYSVPSPTPEDISHAMDVLFDETARSRGYDSRITCALRAGYAGPFHDEGTAFAAWMDTCYATAYQMLAEVQAGTRPMPTSIPEALSLLPVMTWPA